MSNQILIDVKIISKICDVLQKIGAPLDVLCAVGSIGDTLPDEEVIDMLDCYLSNNKCINPIIESDEAILFDVEQEIKRNANKGEV